MRRLQHLPRVERLRVREIVAEAACDLEQHRADRLRILARIRRGELAEAGAEVRLGLGEHGEERRRPSVVAHARRSLAIAVTPG
jgi:hypothetical protein